MKTGTRVYVKKSQYSNDFLFGWATLLETSDDDYLVEFEASGKEYWFHKQRLAFTKHQ